MVKLRFFDRGIKEYLVSLRIDTLTMYVLNELAEQLTNGNKSRVVRTAIWFLATLTSPKLTLRNALKKEAIDAILRGEDVTFIDALKPFEDLLKQVNS